MMGKGLTELSKLLISIELAVVVVAVAVAIAVAVLALVGRLFVRDRGSVSVLVSLVGDDLLPAIGQQDVVAADSLVSIAGLHVSKVVAGSNVVDGVLEGVLGGLCALIATVVGVSVAISVTAAGRSIGVLRLLLLGSRVAVLRGPLLVRVRRRSVLLAGGRGSVVAGGSVLLAGRGRSSVLRAGPLLLLVHGRGSVVGGRAGLVCRGSLDGTGQTSRGNSIVGGRRQVLAGRGILTRRQVRTGHWRLSSRQQDAGEGGENGKELVEDCTLD